MIYKTWLSLLLAVSFGSTAFANPSTPESGILDCSCSGRKVTLNLNTNELQYEAPEVDGYVHFVGVKSDSQIKMHIFSTETGMSAEASSVPVPTVGNPESLTLDTGEREYSIYCFMRRQ